MTDALQLDLPMPAILDFCRRWKIREFAVFGSILRDDFRDDSDVDVMVTFEDDHTWSLLDHVRMERELADMFQRPVDLVTRAAVEESLNQARRRDILESAHVIHAA